ncbi:MAG: nucleotidyltransferase family protein [Marinibacterium sp.]|nr:nucleotidyltransferase family protein [Marinibacterium sp.]
MSNFPILILAAGQSRRMQGRDKLMEEVEGQPLIRRQAEMALQATGGPVIVALPTQPHARYDALDGLDIVRLPVPDANEGMGVSLRTGFAAIPSEAQAAMLLLADLPELTAADLKTVLEAVDPDSGKLIWHATTEDSQRGHPVVFHHDLFAEFAKLSGDVGARDVVKAAGTKVAHVMLPGNRARLDLDTPEAWAAWRARQI